MSEIFATKLGRSFTYVISFDLSTTRNKSVRTEPCGKITFMKEKRESLRV